MSVSSPGIRDLGAIEMQGVKLHKARQMCQASVRELGITDKG